MDLVDQECAPCNGCGIETELLCVLHDFSFLSLTSFANNLAGSPCRRIDRRLYLGLYLFGKRANEKAGDEQSHLPALYKAFCCLLEYSQLFPDGDSLCPAFYPQFGINIADMTFNGCIGNDQLFGDFLVGTTGFDELQYFHLARR